MIRFTKDELETYILTLTDKIRRKPKVLEIADYINKQIPEDTYDSYDEYSDMIVGECMVQRYINLYSLRDLVSMTKRRTKAEMEKEKQKYDFSNK